MGSSNIQEKINNFLLSVLVIVSVYAVLANCFDFFYELNDDLVIKDILAGVYTGKPNGHTNQMLYPLGWLLGCFYHVLPQAPVFGIFLWLCFGLCFGLISYRVQGFFRDTKIKLVTTILLVLVFPALLMWELIYVQYSVVCGVLAGTACFWFYTTPVESGVTEFWKHNIPTILLVWLAFNIRSEMLLLTAPFMAVVGIWHWAESTKVEKENDRDIEKKPLWKHVLGIRNLGKYILFVVAVIFGLGMFFWGDSLAYKGEAWQEYRDFFDARTQVYDFTWYPKYEEQIEFYEGAGISEIQYRLIDNYNFGLDDSINENTLENIASYQERPKMLGDVPQRVKNTLVELLRGVFLPQDGPYNYFVLAAYGLVIGLAVVQRERKYIWKLLLLAVMRLIPWFYLIFVQRALPRVTHPLYVIEFLILMALLVKELYDRPLWNVEQYYRMAVAAVLGVMALVSLPFGFTKVQTEQTLREEKLVKQKSWDDYAKANPENYYYMDVYSTVWFMEKMFADVDNRQKNYDLLGGWLCKSPLQKEAREKYVKEAPEEIETIADLLLTDHFYFVAEESCDVSFVEAYYQEQQRKVKITVQDVIGEGENPFVVYKIED